MRHITNKLFFNGQLIMSLPEKPSLVVKDNEQLLWIGKPSTPLQLPAAPTPGDCLEWRSNGKTLLTATLRDPPREGPTDIPGETMQVDAYQGPQQPLFYVNMVFTLAADTWNLHHVFLVFPMWVLPTSPIGNTIDLEDLPMGETCMGGYPSIPSSEVFS